MPKTYTGTLVPKKMTASTITAILPERGDLPWVAIASRRLVTPTRLPPIGRFSRISPYFDIDSTNPGPSKGKTHPCRFHLSARRIGPQLPPLWADICARGRQATTGEQVHS